MLTKLSEIVMTTEETATSNSVQYIITLDAYMY